MEGAEQGGDTSLKLASEFEATQRHGSFYTHGRVQVGPQQERLFCAANHCIRMINTVTGELCGTVHGPIGDPVAAFAVSQKAQALVVAYNSMQFRHWDWVENRCVRTWKGHNMPVVQMAYDPTGTLVAAASSDGRVVVYDVERGYATHNFRTAHGVITALRFHPSAERLELYAGSHDGHIQVWELRDNKGHGLSNHLSAVTDFTFSAEGSELVSVGRDKVINVWDTHTWRRSRTVPVYHAVEGVTLVASGDHQRTAREEELAPGTGQVWIAGETGTLQCWDFRKRALVREYKDPGHTYHVTQLLSLQGMLVVVTQDQTLLFYAADALRECKRQLVGNNDDIIDVQHLGPLGDVVAVATNASTLKVWHTERNDWHLLGGHKDIILSVDAWSSGKFIVTGSKDHSVRLWDVESRSCVFTGESHTDAVGAVAASRRSSAFFVSASRDRTLKLWNVEWSGDGQVASVSSRWTQIAHEKDINGLDVSPNDQVLATGSQDKTLKLWSTKDLSLLGVCRGHRRGIWDVRFSPVDRCVASCSGDKTIKIWSISDFTCLKTLSGHAGSVLRLRFLTAGMQIVSGGGDGVVKVWVIKTTECVASLDAHEDKVWALSVHPNGKQLLTGGADSVLVHWADRTQAKAAAEVVANEERLLLLQRLRNTVHTKQYAEAFRLALQVDQPARLLAVLRIMLDNGVQLAPLVAPLPRGDVGRLLAYARDWNTQAKHSRVAQALMAAIFTSHPVPELARITNVTPLCEALVVYSERHYRRLDRLLQDTYMVDVALNAMDALVGGDTVADANTTTAATTNTSATTTKTATTTSKVGRRKKGSTATVQKRLRQDEHQDATSHQGQQLKHRRVVDHVGKE